jgi:hypothetical protein
MRNRFALPLGTALALTLWAIGRALLALLSHFVTRR